MSYSYGQLEQLWIQAGGPAAVAPLMAAIALAESGGNPAANNYTDNGGTQTSWGLWQVSNGTHSWPGSGNPNDPLTNAKYAVAKYHSQGLSAWGTYDSGAYRRYYQGGVAPSGLPQGGQQASLALANPFKAVGQAAGLASEGLKLLTEVEKLFLAFFQPATYVRIGAGFFGLLALGFGLFAMTRAATA